MQDVINKSSRFLGIMQNLPIGHFPARLAASSQGGVALRVGALGAITNRIHEQGGNEDGESKQVRSSEGPSVYPIRRTEGDNDFQFLTGFSARSKKNPYNLKDLATIVEILVMRFMLLLATAFIVAPVWSEDAATFERNGIDALRRTLTDDDARLTAAVLLTKSIDGYSKAGAADKVIEISSYLNWCKKSMSPSQRKEFIDTLQAESPLLSMIAQNVDSAPTLSFSEAISKAEKFAAANPDEHFQVAVRYFEIANRYKGKDGISAAERALTSFQKALPKILSSSIDQPTAAGTKIASPTKDALKAAEKSVRDVYKTELASTDAAERAKFALILFTQAKETNDDSAVQYTLLTLAATVSAQAGNLDGIRQAVNALKARFSGDFTELLKTNLTLLANSTKDSQLGKVAVAFRTLIDKPEDAAATTLAGEYLFFEKGSLALGLPMLSKTATPELLTACKLELTGPELPSAQSELADAWWDLAEKTTDKGDRALYRARARTWYTSALQGLTGFNKTKVVKRLETLALGTDVVDNKAPAKVSPPTAPSAEKPTPSPVGNKGELILELSNQLKLELVPIQPGVFDMGAPKSEKSRPESELQHPVRITKPFFMGKYEVTQEQYEAIMDVNPSRFKDAKKPVEHVTWADAVKFCAKLSSQVKDKLPPGYEVQLPTEAQWEYACRAGTKTRYSSGPRDNDVYSASWCDVTSNNTTHPVGEKSPNPWGLYDIQGNVYEWCYDWFENYPAAAQSDPSGPAKGTDRIIRGGSWFRGAGAGMSFWREHRAPQFKTDELGFRVVVTPKLPPSQ